MKIDPCPCVISLKDDSVHTLFQFRDFLELVDQNMGMDAARWLENHVSQAEKAADYTTAKVNTDLQSYEANLDSNRTAFQDIQDAVDSIDDLLCESRVDRDKMAFHIGEIRKIISNQI